VNEVMSSEVERGVGSGRFKTEVCKNISKEERSGETNSQ